MLDLVHLLELIHSGEYLAKIVFAVTEDFEITKGVFKITKDNASVITKMPKLLEAAAKSAKSHYSTCDPEGCSGGRRWQLSL